MKDCEAAYVRARSFVYGTATDVLRFSDAGESDTGKQVSMLDFWWRGRSNCLKKERVAASGRRNNHRTLSSLLAAAAVTSCSVIRFLDPPAEFNGSDSCRASTREAQRR